MKFRAGLFDHAYVDPAKAEAAQLLPDAVAAARTAAGRSMVLLKNDHDALPLDPKKSTNRTPVRPRGEVHLALPRPAELRDPAEWNSAPAPVLRCVRLCSPTSGDRREPG